MYSAIRYHYTDPLLNPIDLVCVHSLSLRMFTKFSNIDCPNI